MKGIFFSVEMAICDDNFIDVETTDFEFALKRYRALKRKDTNIACTVSLVAHCGDFENVLMSCEFE